MWYMLQWAHMHLPKSKYMKILNLFIPNEEKEKKKEKKERKNQTSINSFD